jgi:hypothetical protein
MIFSSACLRKQKVRPFWIQNIPEVVGSHEKTIGHKKKVKIQKMIKFKANF